MSRETRSMAAPSWAVLARYNRRFGDRFGRMNHLQVGLLAVSFLLLASAPVWAGPYLRTLAVACIWAVFAMSWDVQSGYTGYISFGHSVLSGAAGYTIGLVAYNVSPDVSMVLLAPLAVLVALVLGLVIAVSTLRLRGPYFSLLTFVAVLISYRAILTFDDVTNGELGIRAVQRFTFDPVVRYYYALVPMLVVAAGLVYVSRSNVGTVFVAIRENEPAVENAGLDATKFKVWSFVLSSVPMGIGGALLAYFDGFVGPDTFVVVDRSIEMIAMAVLGGMGSVLGPLGGAFFVVLLRDEVLYQFALGPTTRVIALWIVVLLVLVFARHGLCRILWHVLGRVGGEPP